jgi:hypothetical protein
MAAAGPHIGAAFGFSAPLRAKRKRSDVFLLLVGNTWQPRVQSTRARAKWRHFRNSESSLPAYLSEMKGQGVLFLRPVGNSPRSSGVKEGWANMSCKHAGKTEQGFIDSKQSHWDTDAQHCSFS